MKIQITESDINKMVMKTVKRLLREWSDGNAEYSGDYFDSGYWDEPGRNYSNPKEDMDGHDIKQWFEDGEDGYIDWLYDNDSRAAELFRSKYIDTDNLEFQHNSMDSLIDKPLLDCFVDNNVNAASERLKEALDEIIPVYLEEETEDYDEEDIEQLKEELSELYDILVDPENISKFIEDKENKFYSED